MAASYDGRAALPETVSGIPMTFPIRPLLGGRIIKPRTDPCGPQSASSSRQVLVPAGGAPSSPGAWEERSSPARGRRILLRFMTPHEAPSGEQDDEDYAPI